MASPPHARHTGLERPGHGVCAGPALPDTRRYAEPAAKDMPHARPALAGRVSARDAWPAPRDAGACPASGRLCLRPPLGL